VLNFTVKEYTTNIKGNIKVLVVINMDSNSNKKDSNTKVKELALYRVGY
jgi:hypothetical protein